MDGLSAVASVSGIIQAVAGIPKAIDAIRTLFNIEEDLLELLNQLQTLNAEAIEVEETLQYFLDYLKQSGNNASEGKFLKLARRDFCNVLAELNGLADDCQSQPRRGKSFRPLRGKWLWNSKKIEKLLVRTKQCGDWIDMGMKSLQVREQCRQGRMLQEIHTITMIRAQSIEESASGQRLLPQLQASHGGQNIPYVHSPKLNGFQGLSHEGNMATGNNVPAEEMVRIETSLLSSRRCAPGCRCQCHSRKTSYENPEWMKSLLGNWFSHYDILPVLPKGWGCDRPECRRTTSKVRFQYHFPGWLLKRALLLSASVSSLVGEGASLHLNMARIIAVSDNLWLSIQFGEWSRFERLFIETRYLPVDVDFRGTTLLRHAMNWGRWDIVEVLVREWGLKRGRQSIDRRAIVCARDSLTYWAPYYTVQQTQALTTVAMSGDMDEELEPAARQALLKGTDELERLLGNNYAGVNDADDCDRTALHTASLLGLVDAVRLLIRAGATIDARDCENRTALMLALHHCRHNCARALVEAGCDGAMQDSFRNNALYYALQDDITEPFDILQHMVKAQPDIVRARDSDGATVLHWLYRVKGPSDLAKELLQVLLQAGADIEARASNGATPLAYAVQNNNGLAVQMLLQAGANPDPPPDQIGDNLLHCAARFASLDVLRTLVEAEIIGIDVDAENARGFTALDIWRWRRYADNTYELNPGMRPPTLEENTTFKALLLGIRDRTFTKDIKLCQSVLQAVNDQDAPRASELIESAGVMDVDKHKYRGCTGLRTNILLQIKGGMWDTAAEELEAMIESRRERCLVHPFMEESRHYGPDYGELAVLPAGNATGFRYDTGDPAEEELIDLDEALNLDG